MRNLSWKRFNLLTLVTMALLTASAGSSRADGDLPCNLLEDGVFCSAPEDMGGPGYTEVPVPIIVPVPGRTETRAVQTVCTLSVGGFCYAGVSGFTVTASHTSTSVGTILTVAVCDNNNDPYNPLRHCPGKLRVSAQFDPGPSGWVGQVPTVRASISPICPIVNGSTPQCTPPVNI